jgi:pilus assembly protein Flp/PilA
MVWLMERLSAFGAARDGVTALEYGLIVALISVVILASLTSLHGGIDNTFNYIGNRL